MLLDIAAEFSVMYQEVVVLFLKDLAYKNILSWFCFLMDSVKVRMSETLARHPYFSVPGLNHFSSKFFWYFYNNHTFSKLTNKQIITLLERLNMFFSETLKPCLFKILDMMNVCIYVFVCIIYVCIWRIFFCISLSDDGHNFWLFFFFLLSFYPPPLSCPNP